MDDRFEITHRHVRRAYCIGARPALEIAVSYPAIESRGEPLPSAALRFSEAYRTMAEAWLSWAEGPLFQRVKADFAAEGPSAAYRFTRRRASCILVATPVPREAPFTLTVTRTVSLQGPSGFERSLEDEDVWRLPRLTLAPPSMKKSADRAKIFGSFFEKT